MNLPGNTPAAHLLLRTFHPLPSLSDQSSSAA